MYPSYREFFQTATGHPPYEWQGRLANGEGYAENDPRTHAGSDCESRLIAIATGLGKTAGVILAWLWNQSRGDLQVAYPTDAHPTHGDLEIAATHSGSSTPWPRRLVYCLPMRTLVEQTAEETRKWINNLENAGRLSLTDKPRVVILMGGESPDDDAADWDLYPEKPCILIGTQDMLLSRALNRGYGMSRYRWPMHFALLNNDCLWVMDEVQLMGAGIQSARQLEAFRRASDLSAQPRGFTIFGHSFTWYCSATASTTVLNTREWRGTSVDPRWKIELTGDEKSAISGPVAARRLATKKLELKQEEKLADKASDILAKHTQFVTNLAEVSAPVEVPRRTLVICNTVDRAKAVYENLLAQAPTANKPEIILLHSRFRPAERKALAAKLKADYLQQQTNGQIVVSTQVIEAGVDISSGILWSEVAPLSALVQRLGRINRSGEFGHNEQTTHGWTPTVFIVGVGIQAATGRENAEAKQKREEANSKLCLPYKADTCEQAWTVLAKLNRNASPANLATISTEIADSIQPLPYSLLSHELLDFFDTDSNLSLGYTDVSPFVRGLDDDTDVYVIWRKWDENTDPNDHYRGDIGQDEICSVPISRINGKNGFPNRNKGYLWLGKEKGWVSASSLAPFPGCTLLLPCHAGGYSSDKGWTGNEKDKPGDLYSLPELPLDEDMLSMLKSGWQSIDEHTQCVKAQWDSILSLIDPILSTSPGKQAGDEAILWHDFGKNHPQWQTAVAKACEQANIEPPEDKKPWGKFDLSKSPKLNDASGQPRTGAALRRAIYGLRKSFHPGMSHEVASALALRQHHIHSSGSQRIWNDANKPAYLLQLLAEYLVMSHHGRVRKVLRDEIPRNPSSSKEPESVRGIQKGQELETITVCSHTLPTTQLSVDCRKMGRDANGHESYTKGVLRLLDHYGPFRLAYLEMLFRAADCRASAQTSQRQI